MAKLILIAALGFGAWLWVRRMMTQRPPIAESEARAILGIKDGSGR